eukprot:5041857-Prymnesium_polylepis.1
MVGVPCTSPKGSIHARRQPLMTGRGGWGTHPINACGHSRALPGEPTHGCPVHEPEHVTQAQP